MKLWFIWLLRPLKNGGGNSHLESVLSENNNNKKNTTLRKALDGRVTGDWSRFISSLIPSSQRAHSAHPQCAVLISTLWERRASKVKCFLWASLFSLKFIVFLLVGLGLHCCSCFSPAGARGLLSSPGAHASHAGGFSYCRENSIECSTFSSFSSQDLEHRLNSCGTWVYVPHVM